MNSVRVRRLLDSLLPRVLNPGLEFANAFGVELGPELTFLPTPHCPLPTAHCPQILRLVTQINPLDRSGPARLFIHVHDHPANANFAF